MNVYLDTSVVLRHLLHDPRAYVNWGDWAQAQASEIMRIEAYRVMDRTRISQRLSPEELTGLLDDFWRLVEHVGEIPLDRSILQRAGDAFPVALSTLDALHLSSAIAWRDHFESPIVFLTHDAQLALAARAMGFEVQGV